MAKARAKEAAKPATQGKLIPNAPQSPVKGKTTGNGNWDAASHCTENAPTPVIRGSRKSF